MTYDELLLEADKNNLIVREKPLTDSDGRIKGRRVAIRRDIPSVRGKSCALAEELGHHHVNYGDIIDQDTILKRKQEYKARLWGYNTQVGLIGLAKAFESGCRNLYEAAECLDVPEDYLDEVLSCYRNKFGRCTTIDNYVIYFEPTLIVVRIDMN